MRLAQWCWILVVAVRLRNGEQLTWLWFPQDKWRPSRPTYVTHEWLEPSFRGSRNFPASEFAEVHHSAHKRPPIYPVCSHFSSVDTLTSCFFKINFTTTVPSVLRYSKLSLPCRSFEQAVFPICVCVLYTPPIWSLIQSAQAFWRVHDITIRVVLMN